MSKVKSKVILRLPAVRARTGLSRSTIYMRISKGTFPRAYPLGGRIVGWLESDIYSWIEDKVLRAERRGGVRP